MNTLILSEEHWALVELEGVDPYLFRSRSGSVEFLILEEELEQLNDYCALTCSSVKDKLDSYQNERKLIRKGETKYQHPEIGDISEDVILGLEEVGIPKWEQINGVLSQVVILLLLQIFIEKSLKQLCLAMREDSASHLKKKDSTNKIERYILYLNNHCGLIFQEPVVSKDMRKKVCRIRNNFAHGDWECVEKETREIDIENAFRLTSKLFKLIEEAKYPRSLQAR